MPNQPTTPKFQLHSALLFSARPRLLTLSFHYSYSAHADSETGYLMSFLAATKSQPSAAFVKPLWMIYNMPQNYYLKRWHMSEQDLITRYNYDEFTREKVFPWMNFEQSPTVGEPAPSFPLWHLDGTETSLQELWSSHLYTIVEFGSFT
jgi:hypothetical protein